MRRRFLPMAVGFVRSVATIVGAVLALTPAIAAPPGVPFSPPERRVAIASFNSQMSSVAVRAVRATAPWPDVTPALAIQSDAVLRFAAGRLFAISRMAGTVAVIDPDAWTVTHVYNLPAGIGPGDLALTGPSVAVVPCAGSAILQRIDLAGGGVTPFTHLGVFDDNDGNPDLVSITAFEGRLFVSMARMNDLDPNDNLPPGVAVINAATGSIVDADPVTPGIQCIELQGTAPYGRMQVIRETRRMYVKASGSFHDSGGIEEIDLDLLRSNGLRISEVEDNIGADLNAFVMINADDGYLTFSTDLLLSSHLHRFSLSSGPDNGPDILTSLNFATPAMVHDPTSGLLYVPNGPNGPAGVFVLNATSGTILTPDPIAAPLTTDMALITANCSAAGDANGDGFVDGRDIASFVACVTSGADCPCEDLDGDGRADAGDLRLMTALLLSPN